MSTGRMMMEITQARCHGESMMAITQDEHNELLAQIDELGEKLLTAEGQKETAEADLEESNSELETLQHEYSELQAAGQEVVDNLQDTAKALDRLV